MVAVNRIRGPKPSQPPSLLSTKAQIRKGRKEFTHIEDLLKSIENRIGYIYLEIGIQILLKEDLPKRDSYSEAPIQNCVQ